MTLLLMLKRFWWAPVIGLLCLWAGLERDARKDLIADRERVRADSAEAVTQSLTDHIDAGIAELNATIKQQRADSQALAEAQAGIDRKLQRNYEAIRDVEFNPPEVQPVDGKCPGHPVDSLEFFRLFNDTSGSADPAGPTNPDPPGVPKSSDSTGPGNPA